MEIQNGDSRWRYKMYGDSISVKLCDYFRFITAIGCLGCSQFTVGNVQWLSEQMEYPQNRKISCSCLDTNDPKMIDTSFESPKCKL